MAKGTRTKHLEVRLESVEVGLRQSHEQVEERLETVELGARQTQEDVSCGRSENVTNRETLMMLDRSVASLRE